MDQDKTQPVLAVAICFVGVAFIHPLRSNKNVPNVESLA
jgi:hypothetical protein